MFNTSEFQQRLITLQTSVKQSDLDALVLCTDPNITYYIGVHCALGERMACLVIPSSGEPTLIVPRLEEEQLGANTTVKNTLAYWEKDAKPGRNWYDLLYQTLGNAKRIGIDPQADLAVSAALNDYQWEVSTLAEQQRLIKSPAEIALTRRVSDYWTRAMNNMLAIVKAGLPVGELMSVGGTISDEVFANEPSANWINTQIVQFFQCSPASSNPHHLSHRPDELIPHGPTILNAIGAVSGYNAENERTILAGDYTPEHAEYFDMTHRAHELALSLIKPGVPCAEVDIAVQDFVTEQGLAEHLKHRVGHGFGLIDQEAPYLSEGSDEIFQPGMIFSVEPGLYVNGVGGFRHSDTVLVTESGIEVLTAGTPIDRAHLTF
ncbi:Xaa-Pro peptidase family protein [Porticoccaceae bacterium]|nr:Xaa-Pro peptidase family protein [Porticoccaceae bacterium]